MRCKTISDITSTNENTDDSQLPPIEAIFHNDLRFEMWGLFSMYPELSLSDLSDKLGKSKSTIHPHLKLLEKMDIIEMVRREKVRGSIKAKIYSLKKGYEEKISKSTRKCDRAKKSEMDKELALELAESYLTQAKIRKKNIQVEIDFWNKIINSGLNGPDEKAVKLLSELFPVKSGAETCVKNSDFSHIFGYLDAESYTFYQKKFKEFTHQVIEKSLTQEKDNPTIEKPYFIYSQGLPMKKILQYLHPEE